MTFKKFSQMYKISINETPLFLIDSKDLAKANAADTQNLELHYKGKVKLILQAVDMLEKSQRLDSITTVSYTHLTLPTIYSV